MRRNVTLAIMLRLGPRARCQRVSEAQCSLAALHYIGIAPKERHYGYAGDAVRAARVIPTRPTAGVFGIISSILSLV